jgi:hypothetical protein
MIKSIRGADNVLKFERILGGAPPEEAIGRSRVVLEHHLRARSERRRQANEDLAEISKLARKHLEQSTELKRHHPILQEARLFFERRAARKLEKPLSIRVEPRISSDFALKTPPYDAAWASPEGQPIAAQAIAASGTYDLNVQSASAGGADAGAGLGVWFFSADEHPAQRFAALLDYTDDWIALAPAGYFATTVLQTSLWVWGCTENDWVVQSSLEQPFWHDSISDTGKGSASIGDDGGGRVSNETFFSSLEGAWYLCWVWSDAYLYTDSGSFASTQLSVSVPFVVFGDL